MGEMRFLQEFSRENVRKLISYSICTFTSFEAAIEFRVLQCCRTSLVPTSRAVSFQQQA
jgi:hypothetical protein